MTNFPHHSIAFPMSTRLSRLAVIVLAAIAWSLPAAQAAQGSSPVSGTEGIISFDSDITVNQDSTLLVRESITVLASGERIKHGICRDLITDYADRFSNPYQIHFEVGSVNRDDQPDDYHLEKIAKGLRICLGDRSDQLSPGEHTYELTYAVNRVLGFFPDYDELYWNVTGNGWKFPIQATTATVHLARGIAPEAILLDGYTGSQGSAGNDFTASADRQSTATFRATRALAPAEALTLVIRWPKGFVHSITEAQKHQYFLDDNKSGLVALLGLGILIAYYILVWFVAGRGRTAGEMTPRSQPPRGFSPAVLRYVWRMAFDQKTLVVNLVDLAVKKQLAILEDAGGSYILGRVKTRRRARIDPSSIDEIPADMTGDEKLVLEKVFAAGDPVPFNPRNHAVVGATVETLHQHLRAKLERIYFLTTAPYVVPGLLISLAAVIRSGLAIQGVDNRVLLAAATGGTIWTFALLAIGGFAIGTIKNAVADPHHAPTARRQTLLISAISAVLLVGEAAGLYTLAWAASPEVAALMLLLVAINFFFHLRLRAQTLSGHGLMDQIEGLRLFLVETAPDSGEASASCTPAQFERLLPYALALNVEKIWGEKFAAGLAQAPSDADVDYAPGWYSGPNWKVNTASTFLTVLGSSFSSAITWAISADGLKSVGSGASGKRK